MFRRNGSMFIADWKDNLVVKPYTKKSIHEQSAESYKLYMSLGTYQKVADRLEINKEEVQHLVRRFRQSRKGLVNIDPNRRKIKVRNRKEFINTSQIEKLNLKPKTIQILRKNAIMTLRDLTRNSRIELLRINGLGNSVFKEIESCLKEFGLRLAPSKKESVVDIRTLSLQERRALRRPGAKKRLKIEKRARYLASVYD